MKMAQLLELLDVSDSPLFWDLPLMSDDEAREILAQALSQLGAMDAMAPSESPAEELAAQLVQFVVEKGDDDAERKKSVSVGEAIDLAEKIYANEVVLPRMVVFGSLVSLPLPGRYWSCLLTMTCAAAPFSMPITEVSAVVAVH